MSADAADDLEGIPHKDVDEDDTKDSRFYYKPLQQLDSLDFAHISQSKERLIH